MIKRLNHVNINCKNFDEQLQFYCEVLGCTIVVSGGTPESGAIFEQMGSNGPRGAETVVLCVGENMSGPYIELIHWAALGEEKISGPRDIGIARIGFVVDDIDEVYDDFCDRGVRIRTSPHHGGVADSRVRAFFFEDPEGNLLECLQFTGKSA